MRTQFRWHWCVAGLVAAFAVTAADVAVSGPVEVGRTSELQPTAVVVCTAISWHEIVRQLRKPGYIAIVPDPRCGPSEDFAYCYGGGVITGHSAVLEAPHALTGCASYIAMICHPDLVMQIIVGADHGAPPTRPIHICTMFRRQHDFDSFVRTTFQRPSGCCTRRSKTSMRPATMCGTACSIGPL